MIKIISGDINSGKTSLLLKEFKIQKEGVGVFSIKSKGGYNALLLKYENKILTKIEYLNLLSPIVKSNQTSNSNPTIGRYIINNKAFTYITNWLHQEINANTKIFSLDEIGNLELKKEGYYKILNELIILNNNLDISLNLCVRKSIIEELINQFDISHKSKINII